MTPLRRRRALLAATVVVVLLGAAGNAPVSASGTSGSGARILHWSGYDWIVKDSSGPVLFTRVYVKKDGRWQSVAFQQTPIVP